MATQRNQRPHCSVSAAEFGGADLNTPGVVGALGHARERCTAVGLCQSIEQQRMVCVPARADD